LKTIIIDGVIGWDYMAKDFRNSINEAAGDSLDIQISSPGGSVLEGNTIFDLIKKYKHDYPNAKIITTSFGISASQASIIALAGDEHKVYDNTVYIIHNAQAFGMGDHRDLRKTADILEQLSGMASKVYSGKSGKEISEIRQKMDDETYFYGADIVDYGLADEVLTATEKSDPKERLALAELSIAESMLKMKSTKDFDPIEDLFKAAALISPVAKVTKQIPASAGKNKMEVRMNLEELKKNEPELYAQAVQIGKDEEYDRVKAHITMGKESGSIDIAMKHIEEKSGFSSSVAAEYMASGMKNKTVEARKADEVDAGSRAANDDDADTKAYSAKLAKKRGIK
jgi:ATP-dependent Clp protease, protease subunit